MWWTNVQCLVMSSGDAVSAVSEYIKTLDTGSIIMLPPPILGSNHFLDAARRPTIAHVISSHKYNCWAAKWSRELVQTFLSVEIARNNLDLIHWGQLSLWAIKSACLGVTQCTLSPHDPCIAPVSGLQMFYNAHDAIRWISQRWLGPGEEIL